MMKVAVLLLGLLAVASAGSLRTRPHGTPEKPLEGHYRAPHPAKDQDSPIIIPNTAPQADDPANYVNPYHTRAGDGHVIISQGDNRYNADGEYNGKCCVICNDKQAGSRLNRCKKVCGPACAIGQTEGEGLDKETMIGEGDMTSGYNAMKAVDGSKDGPRAPKEEWARYPAHSGTGPQGATGPLADPHILHPTAATGATGMEAEEEEAGPEEEEEEAVSEEEEPLVADPDAPVEEEEGEAEAEAEAEADLMDSMPTMEG